MSPSRSSARAPKQKRSFEVSSILLFALGAFSLVALFTYHPQDPSFFTNAAGGARNACGPVGAYLASLFLECFGIGAFLLPALFFFMAVVVYNRDGHLRLLMTVAGMTVAVMAATVFLTLQWKYWPYRGSMLLTGGAVGMWVAQALSSKLNQVGASIVALTLTGIAIAVSTPVSVARLGGLFLKKAGILSFRLSQYIGQWALYLLGIAGRKLAAHGSAWSLQAVESLKAKCHAFLKERREKALRAGVSKEVVEEAEASEEAIDEKIEKEMKEAVAAAPKKFSPPEIGLPKTAEQLRLLEDAHPGEAPNVLPELERPNSTMIEAGARSQPAILPPEPLSASLGGTGALSAIAPSKSPPKPPKLMRTLKRGQWKLPPTDFLRKAPKVESQIDKEKLIQNSQILQQKFADFGIEGEVTAVRPGPVITLYEFKPGPGVKVSRIAALADDLSMALSAQSVRILAPLPGKAVVGIEIPSDVRETVYIRDFISHADFYGSKHSIPVVMGKDIAGAPYLSDLARMPHVLCAGQTGSGKSVFMNGLICSLIYRFTPDELRMILVDPKFIEFRAYQDLPHLLLPVVDDPHQASVALKWAVREMERRYRILAMLGARNLAAFNQKVDEMGVDVVRDLLTSEENQSEELSKMTGGDWIEAFEPDESGSPRIGKLPFIVVIIDELADLMMIAKKEVEISIARIAQKARAAGIHLVIATQRPSTDVITGLIKANLPSRVSFQLASYIDSKTILDRAGAERLLGQGDMLFIPPGVSQLIRLHGAFVDDEEIGKITAFLKSQGKPAYRDDILVDEDEANMDSDDDDQDELFEDAIALVRHSGHASASFLQRHMKIGYNRAARMIETMESRGIVGPAEGSKPREVLLR